ncbi:unnamed protein product [Tilletia caries]|nr:unnamed protein product [Tilletia caries]
MKLYVSGKGLMLLRANHVECRVGSLTSLPFDGKPEALSHAGHRYRVFVTQLLGFEEEVMKVEVGDALLRISRASFACRIRSLVTRGSPPAATLVSIVLQVVAKVKVVVEVVVNIVVDIEEIQVKSVGSSGPVRPATVRAPGTRGRGRRGVDPSSMSSVQEWVKADSGQWKLSIPGELLLELVELGFRDADIAIMLDCSPGTIYRRRKEMGIEKWNTSIDEQALVEHLVKLRSVHSNTDGERGTMGALNSLGIRVSRSRLRTAIKALDPIGVTSR